MGHHHFSPGFPPFTLPDRRGNGEGLGRKGEVRSSAWEKEGWEEDTGVGKWTEQRHLPISILISTPPSSYILCPPFSSLPSPIEPPQRGGLFLSSDQGNGQCKEARRKMPVLFTIQSTPYHSTWCKSDAFPYSRVCADSW